jgi:transmembrane sensor
MPTNLNDHPGGHLSEPVRTEAAQWFARMRSDVRTDDDAVGLEGWLNADPGHRRAYQRLSERWEQYGAFADVRTVQDARREALARCGATQAHKIIHLLTRPAIHIAASVAATLVVAAIVLVNQPTPPAAYQTGIGERQTLTLADGSIIHLNTTTRLWTAFDENERQVVLEKGQAFFDVASDIQRPFRVIAGSATVTAIGTAFEVHRKEREVVVTLVEGQVRVSEDRDLGERADRPVAPEAQLEAGQRIAFVESVGFSDVKSVDVEPATAWIDGQLIFEDDPLEQALAEVNRYSAQAVRIGDDRLREIRNSGVFRTGSTDTVVEALHDYFGIEVVAEPDGTTTLVPGDG